MVTGLVALGLIVLSTASGVNAAKHYHGNQFAYLQRQALFCGVGVVAAALMAIFDYRKLKQHSYFTAVIWGVVMMLLVTVFFFNPINGSRRWIPLGFFNLQPSELAKLCAVICTSVYLEKLAWKVDTFWKGAIGSCAVFVPLAALVFVEPDFGSGSVVALGGGLVMFLAGVKLLHLFGLGAIGAAGVAVYLMHNANRMARILAFLAVTAPGPKDANGDNAADMPVMDKAAQRADWQSRMSLVAIKNGGIWGVGLGESMQKHRYLPEAHTDFILAIGSEEFGVLFSALVFVLFTAFFILANVIASKATDRLGRYLASGMGFLIYFPAMFNMGVVCRALPTKGIALPFFSYGGTNMISAFAMVGIILSVGIRAYKDRRKAQ